MGRNGRLWLNGLGIFRPRVFRRQPPVSVSSCGRLWSLGRGRDRDFALVAFSWGRDASGQVTRLGQGPIRRTLGQQVSIGVTQRLRDESIVDRNGRRSSA